MILVKSGRHEAGAKAAASHTGALAGSDAVFDAAFRRAGVLRVTTIPALFNLAGILAMQPLPKGPALAIITNAGGPGVMATDSVMLDGGKLALRPSPGAVGGPGEGDAQLGDLLVLHRPAELVHQRQPFGHAGIAELVEHGEVEHGVRAFEAAVKPTGPRLQHVPERARRPGGAGLKPVGKVDRREVPAGFPYRAARPHERMQRGDRHIAARQGESRRDELPAEPVEQLGHPRYYNIAWMELLEQVRPAYQAMQNIFEPIEE